MPYKLLVVDDDELAHTTLDLLFEGHSDFTLEHARSGPEALKMLKNFSDYDLIILDYRMPEMKGSEVARKALLINKDLKIIINSGELAQDIHEECLAAGVIGFVEKNNVHMVAKIRSICQL